MKRFKLAIIIGIIGLIIAVFHGLAIYLFLYWDLPWFDLLMHFLGGLWVALLGIWALALYFEPERVFNSKYIILIALFFALVIGVFWEIFEYYTGLSIVEANFWQDTLTDLLMDSIGAIVAGYYIRG